MKILFVSPLPLDPADDGVKTHLRGVLAGLCRRHEVSVIGFFHAPHQASAWRETGRALGCEILGSLPLAGGWRLRFAQLRAMGSGQPPAFAYYQHRAYRTLLRRALEAKPDWVIFGQYGVASTEPAVGVAKAGTRTMLLPVDSYQMYYRRVAERTSSIGERLTAGYLAWSFERLEREWRRGFDVIAPVAPEDAASLERAAGRARISVLPVAAEARPVRARRGKRIGLIGAFQLAVAEQGARAVLAGWKEATIQGELIVWGRRASARLRQAAVAAGGEYVDWVPDFHTFLDTLDLVIYPQRAAAGVQTKVQQAMALGIPVIAHPEVLAGIGARHGREAFGALTPEEFRETARALLADPERSEEVGRAAHEWIASRFTPSRNEQTLEMLLGGPGMPAASGRAA
ncbi:MAG: glycosyltransferase [Bryobacteraceae bacterium]|nr:glycosyltransferase [Bryobacteraceae bacterium]